MSSDSSHGKESGVLMRIAARTSRRALAVWLCLVTFILLLAEIPLRGLQEGIISIDVKVISLLATVRDKKGKLVSELQQGDFTLEEDGHPQTIRYFSKETDLPLSLGLLVDISGSQRDVLDEERAASHRFLADMLRAGKDQAFILQFAYEVELLRDLTSSREQLEQALDRLNKSPSSMQGGFGRGGRVSQGRGGPSRPGFGGAGTLLYDAIFLASDEVIRKEQNRKALIVLSDGVDTGSKVSLNRAIMTAQSADTVVYSILFTNGSQNLDLLGLGRNGKKILEQISSETGGHMFEVTKKRSIADIYKMIAEELRNQYSIGYSSTQTDTVPRYRKILLKTKQKDFVVQTRDGYYADR